MSLKQLVYTLPLRFRALWKRDQVDQELNEELESHLAMRIEAEVAAGKSPSEARAEAIRAMGNLELRKEQCRDTRKVRWLQDLAQDLTYALRTLAKNPSFSLVAAGVLAIGVGATTAVFTVVNRVLLEPLPFAEPDRLYLVSVAPRHMAFDPGPIMVDRHFTAFRDHNHSFEALASIGNASGGIKMTLTKQGDPVIVSALPVGPDFLQLLHQKPALGRPFLTLGQSDRNAVILSHKLWATRFASDPQIAGKAFTLNGESHTIVGVMPASFNFQNADLWMRDELKHDPHNIFFIPVLGRLKPDVSPAQAEAELKTFAAGIEKEKGFSQDGYEARLLPLKELFTANIRKQLLIFSGAVALVFLIACANFANLLLMRGAGRQPELAVRAALGASRWRLVRQLLTESLLISLLGAILGLASSVFAVKVIAALLPAESIPPGATGFPLNLGVLAFTVTLVFITGVCFGLGPALQATRRELREGVVEGGRSVVTRRERLRGTLVTAEVALALMLLTSAGLLLKSFLHMRTVNPGFRSEGLSVATIDLPPARYKTADEMKAFDTRVLTALSSLPGIKSAAAVSFLPFGWGVMGDFQFADGRHLPDNFTVVKPEVSPNYFNAMGIRILRGRSFNEHDTSNAPAVAIISDSVARRFWPAGNAIGQRISMEDKPAESDWLTIVGIASDTRQQGYTDAQGAAVYQPIEQIRMPGFISHISFLVRSENTRSTTANMRAAMRQVDPDLPVIDSVTTMDSIMIDAARNTALQTRLLTVFAVVALLIAAVGIYGVLAYSVMERLHEFGIRMALGAQQRDILWMVTRQTLWLTGAGVAIGALAALAVTGVLRQFLFEVTPGDPSTFLIVSGFLLIVALAAAWFPAKRAVGVDPAVSLRWE